MRHLLWMLPIVATTLLLMPAEILSGELDALTGGASCTHRDSRMENCDRATPSIPCEREERKACYGEPEGGFGGHAIRCNLGGDPNEACDEEDQFCIGTDQDLVYNDVPACTVDDPGESM